MTSNAGPHGDRVKVLIVDTDEHYLRQLLAALRRRGYEPLVATSYEAAREVWMAERPPMLIAEIRLGQFNGLQLLLRARADRPDVSAIIVSSVADKVLEAETQRFGGIFMVKPVSPEDLIAIIDNGPSTAFIEGRRGERRQLTIPGFSPERRIAERRRLPGNEETSNQFQRPIPRRY